MSQVFSCATGAQYEQDVNGGNQVSMKRQVLEHPTASEHGAESPGGCRLLASAGLRALWITLRMAFYLVKCAYEAATHATFDSGGGREVS